MTAPVTLKATPATLPPLPAGVPTPDQIRLAVSVPSANPTPPQQAMTVELRVPFVLKIMWPGYSIEFQQDGISVRPVFRGPAVLDYAGHPRPDGWSNVQAAAAHRWAAACWQHLYDLAGAQSAQWISLYAQVAGVAVWNVIEALVEAEQEPAA